MAVDDADFWRLSLSTSFERKMFRGSVVFRNSDLELDCLKGANKKKQTAEDETLFSLSPRDEARTGSARQRDRELEDGKT